VPSSSDPWTRKLWVYKALVARDKCSLDLFWPTGKSLPDADSLPDPEVGRTYPKTGLHFSGTSRKSCRRSSTWVPS
jgi:hypothetical protein